MRGFSLRNDKTRNSQIQIGAFKLLWILSCFNYWREDWPLTPLICCHPHPNPLLVIPPQLTNLLSTPHITYYTPSHPHKARHRGTYCTPSYLLYQACNRGINLHVVLCTWRQDHLRPAPQGLPFNVVILVSVLFFKMFKRHFANSSRCVRNTMSMGYENGWS